MPPADVRIEDLAHPRFPPEVAALLDAAGPYAATLGFGLDDLMAEASAQVRLDDFGADHFVEPFSVLLDCVARDDRLSAAGRVGLRGQVVQFLANRLLVEGVIHDAPEVATLELEPPIVIAGLPRSGTTHLHNLLGADPALRALPWWEALEPVPPPGEEGTTEGRIARARAGIDQRNQVVPYLDRMHEMTWDHVHEEIHLLALTGSTAYFSTLGLFPAYREWYAATDQTPYYEYLARVLRVLQHLRGGRRWVLKSPQHLEQFGPLRRVFPGATVVVTHRDPAAVTASFATMTAYLGRLQYAPPIDVVGIGRWWADLIAGWLDTCTAQRSLLPAERSIDVRFDELMADDLAMVREIYAVAGQPFTAGAERAMRAYRDAHPRGRHGRVRYDLGDFRLDAATVRARLAGYMEHFGVLPED
jgi:hypothetical protein